jgi:hypothetical protein
MLLRLFIFSGCFLFVLPALAQQQAQLPAKADTSKTQRQTVVKDSARLVLEKMPSRAARASAIIPGLGQIKNRRWWKVPLIYGGFASFIIAYRDNNRQYDYFLKEVNYRLANNQNPGNPDLAGYSFEGLVKIKDNFRRNKELSIIGGVVLHAVNIIDAYVDAKFFRFDISDQLSMQLRPGLQTNYTLNAYRPSPAMTLKISL